jgi:hypothetical protein
VQLARTSTRQPIALAVDGTHVFWSDTNTASNCGGDPDRDGIFRIAHDGTADPTSFEPIDTFCSKAPTIALGATTVYWARPVSHYIQSKSKIPGEGTPSTVVHDTARAPFGLALDSSVIFWTDQTTPNAKVVRTPLGGTTADLSDSDGVPAWIVVDGQFVYWTTDTKLLKHDKSALGGDPTELHTGLQSVGGLAVDGSGDAAYVTSAGDVLKVPKDGSSSATPLVDTTDLLGGVAVDDTFVYWADTSTGAILRACK